MSMVCKLSSFQVASTWGRGLKQDSEVVSASLYSFCGLLGVWLDLQEQRGVYNAPGSPRDGLHGLLQRQGDRNVMFSLQGKKRACTEYNLTRGADQVSKLRGVALGDCMPGVSLALEAWFHEFHGENNP
jgi:hypothetical protein